MQSPAAVREKQGWQRLGSACLLHWHLCSLDAPTVAVVWALALAQLTAVRLRLPELVVLALGTWIVYVLDRILDGEAVRLCPLPGHVRRLQERHHFHHRHRRVLLLLCAGGTGVLGLLCPSLPIRLTAFYFALGLPVAAYGAWVHRRLIRALWPTALSHREGCQAGEQMLNRTRHDKGAGTRKEAAVAALFTAAVAAPAMAGAQPPARSALLLAALLLAMLCWLNCALISHAEAPSLANRQAERLKLKAAIAVLSCASTVLWAWDQLVKEPWIKPGDAGPQSSSIAAAGLLSCLLLLSLLLLLRDGPAGARRLRVLADVGLLTPLIFMLPHDPASRLMQFVAMR